jgi:hypothetical protein
MSLLAVSNPLIILLIILSITTLTLLVFIASLRFFLGGSSKSVFDKHYEPENLSLHFEQLKRILYSCAVAGSAEVNITSSGDGVTIYSEANGNIVKLLPINPAIERDFMSACSTIIRLAGSYNRLLNRFTINIDDIGKGFHPSLVEIRSIVKSPNASTSHMIISLSYRKPLNLNLGNKNNNNEAIV